MPEVAIGLFPDVGASYFLNQLTYEHEKCNAIGMYLALTGDIVKASDTTSFSISTHYTPSATLLRSDLHTQTVREIALTHLYQPTNIPPSSFHSKINTIKNCFGSQVSSVEQVLAALQQTNTTWSNQVHHKLSTLPPTSLKVLPLFLLAL